MRNRIVAILLVLFTLSLSSCHMTSQSAGVSFAGNNTKTTGTLQPAESIEDMEIYLASVVASEKEELQASLAEDKKADPVFFPYTGAEKESFEAYAKAYTETYESTVYRSSRQMEEAEKELRAMDPTGEYEVALFKKSLAESNYASYHYFTHENSPYKEGQVDQKGRYPDIMELVSASIWPAGLVQYRNVDICITGKAIRQGESPVDLTKYYTPEIIEKEYKTGTTEVMDRFTIIEVTECYWGGLEKGDLIAYAPRGVSRELDDAIANGEDWMLFLDRDGMQITDGDTLRDTYSARTGAYFSVKDGKVKSVSQYTDINQYDENSPMELALTVLRLRAKYENA